MTDGESGHLWSGVCTLLLTTRDRKTGLRRRTAQSYSRDGEHYMLVASKGGSHQHPAWYFNPSDDLRVHVQEIWPGDYPAPNAS